MLEKAGLDREITVTADPALLLTAVDFAKVMLLREGIPAGLRLVGMSVREPGRAAEHLDVHGYHELLAEVSNFVVRRLDADVVFVPMERDGIRSPQGTVVRPVGRLHSVRENESGTDGTWRPAAVARGAVPFAR